MRKIRFRTQDLQRVLARGEEGRVQANQAILTLNDRLSVLAETTRTNQQLMLRIAETQSALGPAMQRLADMQGGDSVARGHLRTIEATLQRMLSDAEQGRAAVTAELRADLRILTRTVAALAEPSRQA